MSQFEIFSRASEIQGAVERTKYLDEACGDDAALRRSVESLLASADAARSFLESPAPAVAAIVDSPDETMLSKIGATPTANGLESGVLGDYRILSEVGRGGMGVVYKAEQVSLGRTVALKVLPFAAILDKIQLARFKNESRAAASLDHPHIVSVYSVGTERGVHYFAMQYIDGQTVADRIAADRRHAGISDESVPDPSGRSTGHEPTEACRTSDVESSSHSRAQQDTVKLKTPSAITRRDGDEQQRIRNAVKLVTQAAEALEHAHRMGIVHRDIKPSNLLVDAEQHVWVADFGLALVENEGNLSTSGSMLGTLRYMSPEQMRAERHVLDHRTDVYSLGATLYEMMTLRPVFTEQDVTRLMQRVSRDEPIAPRKLNSAIPRDLETIVLKAISKDAINRYPSAQDMADDLQRFLHDEPVRAKSPNIVERARKWTRRHRAVVSTAVATLLVAAVMAGGLLWRERSETLAALDQAKAQRQHAQERERQVRIKEREATNQRDAAKSNQYFAEIVSGQAHWEDGHLARLDRNLIRHLPVAGESDRRGWEWYYLLSLCRPERMTLYSKSYGHSATWSPDGNFVAVAGNIWRAESGETFRRYVTSGIRQCGGAWSPDARQLAWGTSGDDNCIYVWDRMTDELRELRGHSKSVWCVAWKPDGNQLASGSTDGTVRIWDAGTWLTTHVLSSGGNVRDLAWSPDGRLLGAVAGVGLKIWNSGTGELETERTDFDSRWDGAVYALSWRPDGTQLAVATMEHWFLLSVPDWTIQRQREILTAQGNDIAWRPDGQTIAVAHNDVVEIWDPSAQEPQRTLRGHLDHVQSVAWSPDGQQLVTSDSAEVKIWDVDLPAQPPAFSIDGIARSIVWLPDNETVVSVATDGRSTSFWNTTDGTQIKVEPASIDGQLHWSPSRELVARSSDSEGGPILQILDAADGSVHSVWQGEAGHHPGPLSWSQDGSKIAISTIFKGQTTLDFWDVDRETLVSRWTQTGRMVPNWAVRWEEFPPFVVWSRDGTRVAVKIQTGLIYVVDVAQGVTTLKHKLGGSGSPYNATCVTFSPDGRSIAAGNSVGLLEMVEIDSGRMLCRLQHHNAMITALAWSTDGQRLVSSAQDQLVKILTTEREGKELLSFTLEGTWLIGARHLSWSPDGRRLLAATSQGDVYVWDASRGYDLCETHRRRGELARVYYRAAKARVSLVDTGRLREVLKLAPDTPGFWELRGHASAELGEFDRAAQEFSKAVRRGLARSFTPALLYGYALLGAGKLEPYRRHCAALVHEFAESPVPSTGQFVARLCTLTGNSDIDSKTVLRLAQPRSRGLVFGAALYRDGQYEAAARVLRDLTTNLRDSSDPSRYGDLACSLYFLAMARHQLGHSFQARRLLDDAANVAEQVSPHSSSSGVRPSWSIRVQLKVLDQETRELMQN